MRHMPSFAVLVVAATSCTAIAPPEPYSPTRGATYCLKTASDARAHSLELFLTGSTVAAAGLVGVVAGLAVGPDTAPTANSFEQSRHLLVIVPSAVVTGLGVAMMQRSNAADTLAERTRATGTEVGLEDRSAHFECVNAHADWSGDTRYAAKAQLQLLQEMRARPESRQAAESAAVEPPSVDGGAPAPDPAARLPPDGGPRLSIVP